MKQDIHPEMKVVTISCTSGCGSVWETLSTKEDLTVEICSNCHPFFTGQERFVDTAGRVELFQRKYGNILEQAQESDAAKDADSEESAN